MEFNSEIYLSPSYKKDDFHALQLAVNSSGETWQKAVDIFADRIEGRFLSQIQVLSDDINKNGFSIMALNCLLIETILQFEIGRNNTPTYNRTQYSGFLLKSFPAIFSTNDSAECFYRDIRCGILHSAQTKGKSKLTCDNSYIVRYAEGGIAVSVKRFSTTLYDYYERYKHLLLDETQTQVRHNFIKKNEFCVSLILISLYLLYIHN